MRTFFHEQPNDEACISIIIDSSCDNIARITDTAGDDKNIVREVMS